MEAFVDPEEAVHGESVKFVCEIFNDVGQGRWISPTGSDISRGCTVVGDNNTYSMNCIEQINPYYNQYNLTLIQVDKKTHDGKWKCHKLPPFELEKDVDVNAICMSYCLFY